MDRNTAISVGGLRRVAWCVVIFMASAGATCSGARDPKKSHNRVELAKDFLTKGQLEAAEQEGQKAVGYDSANAEAHNLLGLVDFMRAAQSYQDREVDQCLTGVDREATLSDFDKHLKSAEQHFKTAVEINDDFGEAWSNRGSTAMQLEQYETATRYFEKALSHPARLINAAITRSHLGWAYFQRGDLVAAAKHLRQSLQFQPGMCVSTYRLGRVYFARKEWQKALEKFQAVTADTSCPIQESHLYLIMTYLATGAPVSAQTVQRCTALAPKSCAAARCRSHAK